MTQNYQNHVRFNPYYHFMAVPLIVTITIAAAYHFYENPSLTHLLLAISFVLICMIAMFARWFALRVQDRAARADERLRYYILTQKMLPSSLRMGQILALRFASDEEMTALVERAVNESLSPKEIKQAIKDWRGDYHRI
jgi:FtsH-binding integral membrane protein